MSDPPEGHHSSPTDDLVGAVGTSDLPDSPSGGPLRGTSWSDDRLPTENRLLQALPAAAFKRLEGKLECLELGLKDLLWEKDEPIGHVYFPLNGVVSLVNVMSDGSSVEVGTVGNEGFVGVPVFLGTDRAPVRAFSQVPGSALRMTAHDLRIEAERNQPFREALQRYTEAFFGMLSQAVACNRVHVAGQRMALWILLVADRVGTGVFPLTQEFLAQMVGVRRATVVEEAGKLQSQRILEFRRGIVTIKDRARLEGAACECYRAIRGEYDRLLKGP